MLFLLKIAITPLLVAGVSIAARWWGPTVGGILMGLPWFTGPTLFVLVQDKGIDFGVAACVGIELGVACVAAFILAYGLILDLCPLAAESCRRHGGVCRQRLDGAASRSPSGRRTWRDGAALGGVGRRPRCSCDRPPSAAASAHDAGVAGAAMVGHPHAHG